MKNIFIFLIVLILSTTAQGRFDGGGVEDSRYHATVLLPFEIKDQYRFSGSFEPAPRSEIFLSGSVGRNANQYLYSIESDRDGVVGSVEIFDETTGETFDISWSLYSTTPTINLSRGLDTITLLVTPVFFDLDVKQSAELPAFQTLERFGAGQSSPLGAVLTSEELKAYVPKAIVLGMSGAGDGEAAPREDVPGWGCGLTCGGVIGAGALATVSGGLLTPGLVLGAAACGSCMGFIWGRPVTSQGPVNLPPAGSVGGSLGGLLPPLPPGWFWECSANSGGGYTCIAKEPIGSLDPY